MGDIENAWKNVTESFKSLGGELKTQYDKAVADTRSADEIEADAIGRKEVAESGWDTTTDRPSAGAKAEAADEIKEALDPASELREDLRADDLDADEALESGRQEIDDTLAPLGEGVERDDISTAFDRARDYLEQAASTVGKVAKDEGTQQAAKDAATAVGDALAATFTELRKALGFDDEDQSGGEPSEESGGSKSDGSSEGGSDDDSGDSPE